MPVRGGLCSSGSGSGEAQLAAPSWGGVKALCQLPIFNCLQANPGGNNATTMTLGNGKWENGKDVSASHSLSHSYSFSYSLSFQFHLPLAFILDLHLIWLSPPHPHPFVTVPPSTCLSVCLFPAPATILRSAGQKAHKYLCEDGEDNANATTKFDSPFTNE